MNYSLLVGGLLLAVARVAAVHEDCPGEADGCPGTAEARASVARKLAREIDLNGQWDTVREQIVSACGLKVQRSTMHCFNDWNHVDCCAMDDSRTHNTNEQSKVVGMHEKNLLGPHITEASLTDHGPGGSWCTCHVSSPEDVCHRQFGARTAFKLVWCHGTGVAALLDDYANVLSSGKPTGRHSYSLHSNPVPSMGGSAARMRSWGVLDSSPNSTWAARWRQTCDNVEVDASHDEV